MLFTMVSLISSVMFPTTAIALLRQTDAGLTEYVVVTTVSVLLAAANLWAVYRAGDAVDTRLRGCSSVAQERWLRLFYLATVLWVFVAGSISMVVTRTLSQLLSLRLP